MALPLESIKGMVEKSSVMLIYIFDENEISNFIREIADGLKLRQIAPLYLCPDLKGWEALGLPTQASGFAVVQDEGLVRKAYKGRIEEVPVWLSKYSHPLVALLDGKNQDRILRSVYPIVIAFFDPEPTTIQAQIHNFRLIAKAHSEIKKHLITEFVWIDAIKSKEYMRKVFGIGLEDLPAYVISEPNKELYYPKVGETKLTLELIPQALEDVSAGRLTPKSTKGFIGNLTLLAKQYWIVTLLVIISFFGAVFYTVRYLSGPDDYTAVTEKVD